MTHENHQLVRDFFAALPSGTLPDELLTADMKAWTTFSGPTDKASYLSSVSCLKPMFSPPISFTINSLTAEEDRVVAEVESIGTLVNGEVYENTYIFVFCIRDGQISSVAEHFNAIVVAEKFVPLMQTLKSQQSQ